MVEKLHVRAADWHEANGSPTLTMSASWTPRSRDRCAKLIATIMLRTYNEGKVSTIERWLTTLGDTAVKDCPLLRRDRRLGHKLAR